MGRKPKNRVMCPKCEKIGTLRLKGRYSVIVSHYDQTKARQGRGKGMKSHYIGSLRHSFSRIVQKYDGEVNLLYMPDLARAYERLEAFASSRETTKEYDKDISIILKLLDELRQLKTQHIKSSIKDRRLHWHIRCKSCDQPYHMYATFKGVPITEHVFLRSSPVADEPEINYDEPTPYKRRYYGRRRRRY